MLSPPLLQINFSKNDGGFNLNVTRFKYTMLVTLYAIWYLMTELLRPSWQKDFRDITFYFMEEHINQSDVDKSFLA